MSIQITRVLEKKNQKFKYNATYAYAEQHKLHSTRVNCTRIKGT